MNTKRIFTLFTLLVLLTACENKVQKGYEFIKEYNNAAPLVKNNLIYRTEAKIIGERILDEIIIEIDYDLNLKRADCETDVGVRMLPKSIYHALIKSEAGKLINQGATFNLTFRSLDNYILHKKTIDKKLMLELQSENQTHLIDEFDFSYGKNPDLIKVLANINRSLPIEDENDQTKLIKLNLDKFNNIICITEVPDNSVEKFKSPEMVSDLKEIISKRKNDQILNKIKETYNLEKIIYRYQNAKGEIINQINIE